MAQGRSREVWGLVGLISAVLALGTALVLAVYGTGESGLRTGIRVTARTSYALFLAAFVASSAAAVFPSRLSKWLLRSRRALGVSFAVSMGMHGALILALAMAHRASFFAGVNATSLIGGGAGYVLIALMTATSFDRSAKWLGRRRWKALHTTGMYYLWIVFMFSYLGRAHSPAYAVLVGLLLLALGLRVAAALRRVPRSARAGAR